VPVILLADERREDLLDRLVLGGHPGKPRPRFFHEANVRGIRLPGVESNHLESWRRLLRERGRHAQTGRENGDATRLDCHLSIRSSHGAN
jgi:hypothetical protein